MLFNSLEFLVFLPTVYLLYVHPIIQYQIKLEVYRLGNTERAQ